MTRAALIALLVAAGSSALASDLASSTASSASSAGSASSGSVSDSLRGSSNSSTKPNQVTAGEYRIRELAALPERPGHVMLQLQALARPGAEGEIRLIVPQQVVGEQALAAGRVLRAAHQPYGLAFALAEAREPFFLVLADEWQRELPARPVAL